MWGTRSATSPAKRRHSILLFNAHWRMRLSSAEVIGEKRPARSSQKRRTDLAQAINTVLWDEAGGCYYSGYFSDEDVAANPAAKRKLGFARMNHLTPTTLHANVFALDRGVVPDNPTAARA